MACLRILLSCLVILGIPTFVFCGECCKAHYDALFEYNDEKWCSNYCCIQLGKFDCCDSELLQAPPSKRVDFCSDYFDSHVWAAVLIAIGSIALIVACCVGCVCCCKACCGGHQSVGVVMQGAPNPGVTVVNSGMQMQQPGYPSNSMQQQPGYPTEEAPSYPV